MWFGSDCCRDWGFVRIWFDLTERFGIVGDLERCGFGRCSRV